MRATTYEPPAGDFPTVEIPVIDGEIVEDYPTAAIPRLLLLPPVPQSARVAARLPQSARVAARLPLSARVARRAQVFRRSVFVADLRLHRFELLSCSLVLALAAVLLLSTRGQYWTGTEWAPIPTVGTPR